MRGRRKDRAKSSDKHGGGDSKVKERPSSPVEDSPDPTAVTVEETPDPVPDPEPEPSIEVVEVEEEPDGSVQVTDTVAVLEPDGSIEVERTVALLEPDGTVEVIETDEAVIGPEEAESGRGAGLRGRDS